MSELNAMTGKPVYLFADQANAELDDLRLAYAELLLRFDADRIKHNDLAQAYDRLLERYRNTAAALSRTLEVLSNVAKTMEKRNGYPENYLM